MHSIAALILAAAASGALAETFTVVAKEGNTFEPSHVEAKKGDVIEFQFEPANHSVVQGNPEDEPCKPLSGGFNSGFMPVSSGTGDKVFRVTIEDEKTPIIFYCAQGAHCGQGMVGGINIGANFVSQYSDVAKEGAETVLPDGDGPTGGVVADFGSEVEADDSASSGDDSSSDGKDSSPTGSSDSPEGTGASDKDGAAGSVRAGLGFVAAFAAVAAFMA